MEGLEAFGSPLNLRPAWSRSASKVPLLVYYYILLQDGVDMMTKLLLEAYDSNISKKC